MKAFVSSTFEDLKDHRVHVITALRDAGFFVDPMENWTAAKDEPREFSQERINGCDLCVLLVAYRRGYVPEGQSLSITQLEYQAANRLGVDVLVFMLDDRVPWLRDFDECDRDPELEKWRKSLKESRGISFFTEQPGSVNIAPALTHWICERHTDQIPGGQSNIDIAEHLELVIDAFAHRRVIPFLGADINLCGRKGEDKWYIGASFPPSSQELAAYLDEASSFDYRSKIRCPLQYSRDLNSLPRECPVRNRGSLKKLDLQHVAQNIVARGSDDERTGLKSALIRLSNKSFLPNPAHEFLANLCSTMYIKGYYPPYPLIVTSCFDSTLERAFDEAEQPYDLVAYVGTGHTGCFVHRAPGEEEPRKIDKPNEYDALSFKDRPTILKLYGGYRDSVITEDHYIDYLAHRDIQELLPARLLARLNDSTILFLGYSLSYWNSRVILHRLWPGRPVGKQNSDLQNTNWAVQENPEEIDEILWKSYSSVSVGVPSLDEYIKALGQRVPEIPPKPKRAIASTDQAATVEQRCHVFISYSHKDRIWLDKLKIMLAPVKEKISFWEDTLIDPGDKWRKQIKEAIGNARVAVLLVSKHFLDSRFIANQELPPILDAAERNGLKIFWVYISHCLHELSDINDYQAAHDITLPLAKLSEEEQDNVLAGICRKIIKALGPL